MTKLRHTEVKVHIRGHTHRMWNQAALHQSHTLTLPKRVHICRYICSIPQNIRINNSFFLGMRLQEEKIDFYFELFHMYCGFDVQADIVITIFCRLWYLPYYLPSFHGYCGGGLFLVCFLSLICPCTLLFYFSAGVSNSFSPGATSALQLPSKGQI